MNRMRSHIGTLFVRTATERHACHVGPRERNSWLRGLGMTLFLVSSGILASGGAVASEKYGGVEIGAKGIKASAVEVDTADSSASLKVLELEKRTVDVTLSRLKGKRFDTVLIDDVASVVEDFIKALKSELGVPEANIQVVASSGVPFAANLPDLVAAIRKQTGKDLDKIDATEEATLAAIALVPKDLRTKAVVIDIGSGNTKGGAFLDESGSPERFATVDVPFGTTTLSKAIDKEAAEAGKSKAEVAREAGSQLFGAPFRQQLTEKPELGQRNVVLFGGGSVWAFVTIMRPETALEPFPKVTAADIKAYVERITQTPGKYPEVEFGRVKDAAVRKAASADYDRIRGASGATPVFKPEELQAGAVLLEQVSDALAFSKRTVYFDRKAVTAWITARITPPEFRHLLPQALGRKLTLPVPVTGGVEPQPEACPDSALKPCACDGYPRHR